MSTLSKLKFHEKLLIWRRRQGMDQIEAAHLYDLPVKEYRNWEKGRRPDWKDSTIHVRELTIKEECLILRRRSGILQRELAKKLGCHRVWINEMEKGRADATPLREFWNGGRAED